MYESFMLFRLKCGGKKRKKTNERMMEERERQRDKIYIYIYSRRR